MLAALALAILLGPSVLAAPAATQKAAVTPESIESAIQEIEAREGLDEELKTKLLKLYRRIRSRLDDTRAHEAAAEAFHKAIAATPKEIGEIRKRLDIPSRLPTAPADLKIEGLTFPSSRRMARPPYGSSSSRKARPIGSPPGRPRLTYRLRQLAIVTSCILPRRSLTCLATDLF